MQDGLPHYTTILHTCSAISIPVNLMGIYVILTQSSSSMKKYKWYLLNVQLWVFLTDLILFVLIAPRFYFPLIAGTMHGVFFHLGVPYEIQTIIGFGTGVGMISACTQAIQYRHSQIVPPSSYLARKPRVRVALNCIRYFVFCQVSVPAVLTEPRNQIEAKMRVAEKFPYYPEFFFDPSVYLLQESPFFVVLPGLFIILYVSIELFFYIFQSFRQLSRRISHMSERTRRLQRKYFLCVCTQVLVPCVFCVIPIGFLCFAISSGYHVQFWNDIAVLTFGLHGIFATLIMLVLYQPSSLHETIRGMDCEGRAEKSERPVSGRVPLKEVEYGSAKFYMIAGIKWTVHIGNSITHNFNHIRISTDDLKETEFSRVDLEVCAPKLFPGRNTFWHLFDYRRNIFSIPFPDSEQQENRNVHRTKKPTEGTLEKKKGCGPYIRFVVQPKKKYPPKVDIWTLRNPAFPFADLTLKVGEEEIYVNKKILSATSRFFMYIIGSNRVKMIGKPHQLHVTHVRFEDLYDLIGYIYHDWQFGFKKSLYLQEIAEQFGVMMHANNAEDFEGRTSMEYLSRRCYDGIARESRCLWHEVYFSSDGETTNTSVFEKSDNEEEEEETEDNNLDDNDADMLEPPNSPMTVSPGTSMSAELSPSPDPLDPLLVNRDFSQQFDNNHGDFFDDVSHEDMRSVSSLMGTGPPQQPAPALPDLGYDGYNPFPPNDPYLIETRQGTFTFMFNIHNTSRGLTRGHREAVSTSFGRWDVYLYRRFLNSEEFLSLGIYVNELSPVCNYNTEVRVTVSSLNMKPFRKILTKMFSYGRISLGYPNFIPWSDALNWSENGSLTVTMYVILKVTDMPMPIMHYDMFPGQKDVLVKVEDTVCPVSKDVLCDASPVLKQIFDSGFVPIRSRVYQIPDFSYRHFILTLDLIYNRVTTIRVEDIEPLMQLAHKYKIQFMIDQLGREYVDKCYMIDQDMMKFAIKYKSKTAFYAHYNQQEFFKINRAEPLTTK